MYNSHDFFLWKSIVLRGSRASIIDATLMEESSRWNTALNGKDTYFQYNTTTIQQYNNSIDIAHNRQFWSNLRRGGYAYNRGERAKNQYLHYVTHDFENFAHICHFIAIPLRNIFKKDFSTLSPQMSFERELTV